jgi:hypothetical protein
VPVCPECWRKTYLLRALIFPVAEPLSGSWQDLDKDLHAMWSQTTAAANWMMTECYARDVRRVPAAEEKMPPMRRVYLYPEARERFPALPPQSVASLEQVVQRRYRAARYDVIWRSAAALPTMRYPPAVSGACPILGFPLRWREPPHCAVALGGGREVVGIAA